MIIGPPRKDCGKRGYPCDKKDCSFYRQWGFLKIEPEKKKWWKFWQSDWERYAPRWITFGVYGCENCEYFRGFDLFEKK